MVLMLPLATSSMETSQPTQTFYNLRSSFARCFQPLTRKISTSFGSGSKKSLPLNRLFLLSRYQIPPKFLHSFAAMAASAAFTVSSPSFVPSSCKIRRPFLLLSPNFFKPVPLRASAFSVDKSSIAIDDSSPVQTKRNNWQWKFKGNSIGIYYEEHEREKCESAKTILMIPTISDVSTVEEWRSVAKDIVQRNGEVNWRATIVDWPGLGYSDRPKMDYDTDVMEKFVVDFMNSPESPMSQAGNGDLVIIGGGHAATLAIRATQRGLLKPSAIAAVAPTWAGPLPIVFGRDSSMETRYGLLRGTLRAPGVGWMMYNMLVSNEKSIESQYKSHVYADQTNVTEAIIQSRYELTKKKGSRYVPAAFLTGLLDPVSSRDEFLQLFADLEGKFPVMVMSTKGAPKRSKAEMEALRGAKGVSKFVEVEGALLPQEEYPSLVAQELYNFLQETFASPN